MIHITEPVPQIRRVERYLRERPNQRVPMPEIASACGTLNVHSVIHRLRITKEMTIENVIKRTAIGNHSWYVFVPDEGPPKRKSPRANAGHSSE